VRIVPKQTGFDKMIGYGIGVGAATPQGGEDLPAYFGKCV
jgi:hypothetical protein